ncbi:hypothetical protein ACQR35_11210 [Pseudarthrobacter sp. J1738]|uniref:hypothetical protein n=1 Tax=unclassified Pseudarthrobacter TaxID=2647000 RepID=UPI003D2A0B79
MGIFSVARQGKRDDKELGKGLWRRAHDRFQRGLDRYHQVLEGVEDDALYNELVLIANDLSQLLPRVRAVCAAAQKQHPSEELEVPIQLAAVHRALSNAGNDLATTAQAAAMLRLAVGPGKGPVSDTAVSVRRRAEAVSAHVHDAERQLSEQAQL